MTGAALASKDLERMPASAGQTEYDRTANTRVDVWERVKESASEEPKSLNDLDTEIGGQTIGVSEDDSARAADLYERLVQDKENTEFGAFLEDLDYYDEVLEDPEGDYTKLAPRISRLEDMDYNWEPAGSSIHPWSLISVTELGSWEPATGTRTTNFTQTRNRLLDYQRLVEEKERNIATQEVRVASSTYETDPRTDTISRNINVALGGWTNTGGLHSCTTWSPATNTVDQGKSFTQTRTCKQNQQRSVSYTVASTGENPGGAWTDTKTIDVNRTQSAIGTKVTTGEWFIAGAKGVNSPNPDSDPNYFHDGYSQTQWNGAPSYLDKDAPWLNTETNKTCQPIGDKFSAYRTLGGGGYRHIYFIVCR